MLETEAKIAQFLHGTHGTFITVDREPEFVFEELTQPFEDSARGSLRTHQDNEVIRVTHETMAAICQLLIQCIEHQIRHQGR